MAGRPLRLRLALLVTHQRADGLQTPTGSKSQFELVNQRAAFPFSRMTRRGDEQEDTNTNGDQMFVNALCPSRAPFAESRNDPGSSFARSI